MLVNLGDSLIRQGDTAAAAGRYEEAVPLLKQLGDQIGLGLALAGLGQTALLHSDAEQARNHLVEGLALLREVDHAAGIAHCLDWLAALCCTQEQWQAAAQLAGAASIVREAMGVPLNAAYLADPDRYLEAARNVLGPSGYAEAYEKGRTRPLDQILTDSSSSKLIG
jgi:hypothetical protein